MRIAGGVDSVHPRLQWRCKAKVWPSTQACRGQAGTHPRVLFSGLRTRDGGSCPLPQRWVGARRHGSRPKWTARQLGQLIAGVLHGLRGEPSKRRNRVNAPPTGRRRRCRKSRSAATSPRYSGCGSVKTSALAGLSIRMRSMASCETPLARILGTMCAST